MLLLGGAVYRRRLVYGSMWFSGGTTACDMVMTMRWELAHISNGISILQEHVGAERTASSVFIVFVYSHIRSIRQIRGSK